MDRHVRKHLPRAVFLIFAQRLTELGFVEGRTSMKDGMPTTAYRTFPRSPRQWRLIGTTWFSPGGPRHPRDGRGHPLGDENPNHESRRDRFRNSERRNRQVKEVPPVIASSFVVRVGMPWHGGPAITTSDPWARSRRPRSMIRGGVCESRPNSRSYTGHRQGQKAGEVCPLFLFVAQFRALL